MHRFFLPPAALAVTPIPLEDDTLHHLRTVLRLGPGDELILLDGAGALCHARISRLDKKRGEAEPLVRWREEEHPLRLHLLQGLPKGEKMELVLQKGTELGVKRFTPVLCQRTQREKSGTRMARWEKIVQEAARQCRRPCLPELVAPLPLAEALAAEEAPLKLMLWEEGSVPLAQVLPPEAPSSIAFLVGPEGGFSAEEAELAQANGFLPVSVGPRILRSETAGFTVAAILQYLYGDLNLPPVPASAPTLTLL